MVQTLAERRAKAKYYQKMKKLKPDVVAEWNKRGHEKYYDKHTEKIKKAQRQRYRLKKLYNLENERLVKLHKLRKNKKNL